MKLLRKQRKQKPVKEQSEFDKFLIWLDENKKNPDVQTMHGTLDQGDMEIPF